MRQVKFYTADWCSVCKQVMPIFKSIAEAREFEFNIIDIENPPEPIDIHITSVPVTLINYNGQIASFVGPKTAYEFGAYLDKMEASTDEA